MPTRLVLAAIIAAQTGGPPRPAIPAQVPPPAPQTDWPPLALFSPDDYPAAAMRGDDEGPVRYRLEIGPDGRVSTCAITASSGSTALDSATCRILRARARFRPARDGAGNPVPDAREGEVTWRMEGED